MQNDEFLVNNCVFIKEIIFIPNKSLEYKLIPSFLEYMLALFLQGL